MVPQQKQIQSQNEVFTEEIGLKEHCATQQQPSWE